MAELAVITKNLDFHLEQVQDFTPTPMTISTEMWYTGYDPYTLEPVYSAKTPKEKLAQRMFFFWYKPEERRNIEQELKRIGRPDLINKLYDRPSYAHHKKYNQKTNFDDRPIGSTYDNPGVTGYFKKKEKKSFNPNFNSSNHKKQADINNEDYRKEYLRKKQSGDMRGRNNRH